MSVFFDQSENAVDSMEVCMESVETNRINRRKTRRGKKKYRSRFLSSGVPCCECLGRFEVERQTCAKCEMGVARADENQVNTHRHDGDRSSYRNKNNKQKSKHSLRPITRAGAPHNSNQFLIEDRLTSEEEFKIAEFPSVKHDQKILDARNVLNDDHSFYESTSAYYKQNDQCLSPDTANFNWKTSPAFSDVDYKYVPIQDEEDMIMFLQKDFEDVYQCTREQELIVRDRTDLISGIQTLRTDVDNLRLMGDNMIMKRTKCDCDVVSLQRELDELKKINLQLTKENQKLKQSANAVWPVECFPSVACEVQY